MTVHFRFRVFPMCMLCAVLFVSTLFAGPLEEYVHQPDDSFSWRVRERKNMDGLDVATLALASQTWHGGVWSHELYIAKPENLQNPATVFLEITWGVNHRTLPAVKALAEQSGTMVAVLTAVPNQPLCGGKSEDALVAYTFDQYLKSGDATWPLLLPMVKSAVRAMDAIQAWARSEHLPPVERFVVSGASKRGWTTWLTGAVDKRVCAIAPAVIDMLNMKAQTRWSLKVYGGQSEKINDYTDLNLIARIDEPATVALRNCVDPYSYRQAYTMPKLIILGTNDPYWTVDSLRHYWDGLPAPKLVYQAPNAGHGAAGTPGARQTLAAFLRMIAEHKKPPQLTWTLGTANGGRISVRADRGARQACLWTAHSEIRDFRKAVWSGRPLALDAGATHAAAEIASPKSGYTAFMAEFTFAGENGQNYRLSSQVQVIPDDIPLTDDTTKTAAVR